MENTELEQDIQPAVSEQAPVESQEEKQDQTMVPLAALQAERRKRQDLEARNQVYEELMRNKEQPTQEEEDPNALVEKHHLQEWNAQTKRDIMESIYQESNPEAVQQINKHLKTILEKKPWLAASVDSAPNRYARAFEIVSDYMHLTGEKPVVRQSNNNDGQRIVQNAQKPRSPIDVGKSARPEGMEYLKSIQGKKEFREYREKVLRGET